MASGHGVDKPRREGDENRQVHRNRFIAADVAGERVMNGPAGGSAVGSFDLTTGTLHNTAGTPIAGRGADKLKQRQRIAAQDAEWEAWHAKYEAEN